MSSQYYRYLVFSRSAEDAPFPGTEEQRDIVPLPVKKNRDDVERHIDLFFRRDSY